MAAKKSTVGCALVSLLIFSSALISGCGSQEKAANATANKTESSAQSTVYTRPETVTSAADAKQLLIDGNKRFTEGKLANQDLGSTKREALLKGQQPFATIIGCSDSRVPPELLFDQGLGDLFIIRDAGNIVDPVTIGSVEYAVEHLKTPLLVILGHEKCGAVTATVEGGEAPGSIGAIVEKIKPSVEKVKVNGITKEELIEKSSTENVKATIVELEKSPIVKEALESGKLTILGAKYHLDSGEVEWFDTAKEKQE